MVRVAHIMHPFVLTRLIVDYAKYYADQVRPSGVAYPMRGHIAYCVYRAMVEDAEEARAQEEAEEQAQLEAEDGEEDLEGDEQEGERVEDTGKGKGKGKAVEAPSAPQNAAVTAQLAALEAQTALLKAQLEVQQSGADAPSIAVSKSGSALSRTGSAPAGSQPAGVQPAGSTSAGPAPPAKKLRTRTRPAYSAEMQAVQAERAANNAKAAESAQQPSRDKDDDQSDYEPEPAGKQKGQKNKPAAQRKVSAPAIQPQTSAAANKKKWAPWAAPKVVSSGDIDLRRSADDIFAKGAQTGHLDAEDVFSLLAAHGIDPKRGFLYFKVCGSPADRPDSR